MIKEEDYLKAKQIVQEYEKQLNISDVSNAKRTVCKNCLGEGEFPASVGYMRCEKCKGTGFLQTGC